MLFIKRLFTAAVLFVVFFVVFFILSLAVAGGVAGAKAAPEAGAKDFQAGYAIGQKAGAEVSRKYGRVLMLGSAGTAVAASLGLTFLGVLPWCRRQDKSSPPAPPRTSVPPKVF